MTVFYIYAGSNRKGLVEESMLSLHQLPCAIDNGCRLTGKCVIEI